VIRDHWVFGPLVNRFTGPSNISLLILELHTFGSASEVLDRSGSKGIVGKSAHPNRYVDLEKGLH
jgi:hypothetical protein